MLLKSFEQRCCRLVEGLDYQESELRVHHTRVANERARATRTVSQRRKEQEEIARWGGVGI